MKFDDLAMLAYKNMPPEYDELSPMEWCCFYRLRDCYSKNKHNPEEGSRQKVIIQQQFDRDKDSWSRNSELHEILSSWWKKLEPVSSAYALNPSIENADRLFETLYGVPRKKQLEKWKGGDGT